MINGLITSCLVILLSCYPAFAFVEKLAPNVQGNNSTGIPCHAIGELLRVHVAGIISAGQVGTILLRDFVPGGWSAQDNTDNSALLSALAGMTQEEKEWSVARVEGLCILWELGVDEVDSPAEYRTILGSLL